MAERNVNMRVEQRIEFRVGINVGDVVVEDGDIFGDGVNGRAARFSVRGIVQMEGRGSEHA